MNNTIDHSPDRRYVYFKCSAVDIAIAAVFGVLLKNPRGTAYYYYDDYKKRVFKNLGALTVSASTGRITVHPLNGLKDTEVKMLVGAAENAFREPPTKAGGWKFHRRKSGNYWTTLIAAPVDPRQDAVAEAVMTTVPIESEQLKGVEKQITEITS